MHIYWIYRIWLGLVLSHINHCWLFNAKSSLYIYIKYIRGAFNKFPDFFVQAFKIVVDSWKFSILLQYILWENRPILYDFSFKWTATAVIGIHPTEAWLSQLVNFKNAIWTWGTTICNKILFKLGKNATETYGMLQTEHQFLRSIRDLRKAGSLWGMIIGVGGRKKSIHQSWLAKGLRLELGLLCWGFKGVQEEIPREEANTVQIGSVAFPAGQCTSPQLHPCHSLFDQDGHQDSSSPSI